MKTKNIIKGKKGQQLNQREAKLINDSSVDGLLLFHHELKDDRIILSYNIDGLVSLVDFLRLGGMSKRMFVVLLRNIVVALKSVEENRFSKDLIMWSLETSYVDPATWHVYLMYIPLQPYEAKGNFKDFILDFVANCTFDPNENAEYVQTLVMEINSGVSYTAAMLENFCDRISAELVDAKIDSIKLTRCPSCNMALNDEEATCPFCGKRIKSISSNPKELSHNSIKDSLSSHLPLHADDMSAQAIGVENKQLSISVSEDENGVITVFRRSPSSTQKAWLEDRNHYGKIRITKFPFRIGKMEGVTDYRIYNNTVSRKHADILKEQSKYYLVDLGSTNGTYLNGKRVQPGVKEELFDGVYLRFADVEYKFHVD